MDWRVERREDWVSDARRDGVMVWGSGGEEEDDEVEEKREDGKEGVAAVRGLSWDSQVWRSSWRLGG